jgi:glycosyltransferase involved in cell wall biosynthesis
MTLGVDARWMVGQYRGMGRYAHALIEPVAAEVLALLPRSYPKTRYLTLQAGPSFFPYWEQVVLPRLCANHGVTQLFCPYNTAPLNVPPSTQLTLVVHDLIYLESWSRLPPSVSIYQTLGRVYRRWVVPRVARQATRLVTVSAYTRNQISKCFSIPEQDIHVIPSSVDDAWYVETPLPWACRQPYILTVSGEAPSKNLPSLIRAFAAFRHQAGGTAAESRLRIVGIKPMHQPHFQRIANAVGVGAWLDFEPFIDEAALQKLYREAWLFVMPSLYEGFGLPLVEAMASGTPVVCSNTTSLPEVVGDAGWLFDPRNIDDMATQLHSAWCDQTGKIEMANQGLVRAKHYSRFAVAETIKDFWRTTN